MTSDKSQETSFRFRWLGRRTFALCALSVHFLFAEGEDESEGEDVSSPNQSRKRKVNLEIKPSPYSGLGLFKSMICISEDKCIAPFGGYVLIRF